MARLATTRAPANVHYEIAVFHDNNSREAEAIPHYAAALKLGLTGKKRAEAHAYLASSYWKIGKPQSARRIIAQSKVLPMDKHLRAWMERLHRRIVREPFRFKK